MYISVTDSTFNAPKAVCKVADYLQHPENGICSISISSLNFLQSQEWKELKEKKRKKSWEARLASGIRARGITHAITRNNGERRDGRPIVEAEGVFVSTAILGW